MDELMAVLFDMATKRPGWTGGYTERQAPGAMANGTRIVKVDQDTPADLTKLGTVGTVLGSMSHPTEGICYFVEWDDKPKCAVAVIAWKIAEAN